MGPPPLFIVFYGITYMLKDVKVISEYSDSSHNIMHFVSLLGHIRTMDMVIYVLLSYAFFILQSGSAM